MSTNYHPAQPEYPDNRSARNPGGRSELWPVGNRASYIVPARELNRFHLGDGCVDIRGWPVFDSRRQLVGAVDRLMIESASKKVRYIGVSLVREGKYDFKLRVVGSVLVPVGVVRRLEEREAVLLEGLTGDTLARAPRLRARAVTRADEDATLEVYGMQTSYELPATEFYESPNFDGSMLAVGD